MNSVVKWRQQKTKNTRRQKHVFSNALQEIGFIGRRSYSMIREERCLAVRISLVTKQGKKRYKDPVTRLYSAQDSGDGGYTIPCK